MPVAVLLKPTTYRDSVALMVLSGALAELDGVVNASAVMATPANVDVLRATGLHTEALDAAGPNDLCVAVEARDAAAAAAALARAEALLAGAGGSGGAVGTVGLAGGPNGGAAWRPRTIRGAVQVRPDANLALISVPGEHAALEAQQALTAGLHVFLFSDNVALADEIALKRQAAERGLLLMGPDCGTAIIGGAPLGFANAVRRGPIGLVGSSGTGLQEVTSLIHQLGGGVSHAIGTGGRDLYGAVGGLTFLAAVDALAADPATTVLVAVGKPGDGAVRRRVLERLAASGKPSVVYFLGADDHGAGEPEAGAQAAGPPRPDPTSATAAGGRRPAAAGPFTAANLEHAAHCAVAIARGDPPPAPTTAAESEAAARGIVAAAGPRQHRVCGLFAGGTLAQEAATAVARALGRPAAPAGGTRPGEVLRIPAVSVGAPSVGAGRPLADASGDATAAGPDADSAHTVLDLGDDAYTRGRPHPMIDPRLRNAELLAEAGSGTVALFLLDVILGSGAHADPAGALAPALAAARAATEATGGTFQALASLCGTDQDSQGYQQQRAILESAGVRVAASASAAAALAGRVARLLAERDGAAGPTT